MNTEICYEIKDNEINSESDLMKNCHERKNEDVILNVCSKIRNKDIGDNKLNNFDTKTICEEEHMYENFYKNIKFHDNRYCVKLPFKDI